MVASATTVQILCRRWEDLALDLASAVGVVEHDLGAAVGKASLLWTTAHGIGAPELAMGGDHYASDPSAGSSVAGTSSRTPTSMTSARSGIGSPESSEYLSMRKRSRYMNDAAVPTFRMSV